MQQAIINYLPPMPAPEQILNYRGLKSCWIVELPGIIIYSADREKCICKAKAISKVLTQIKKCDQ